MITIAFYKNGAYVTGHDTDEICTLISYAMWACIEDCLQENDDVCHYESGFDENWKHLGFTYIKINKDVPEHNKILERFRKNLSYFISRWDDVWDENDKKLPDCEGRKRRVQVNSRLDEYINWDTALQNAKQGKRDYEI